MKIEINYGSSVKHVTISGVGIRGAGVPTGGAKDMLLTKKSSTDYDTEWTNILDGVTIDANMNGGYF